MQFKRNLLLIILSLFFIWNTEAGAQSGQGFTLKQAIQLAMERNAQIQQYEEKVAQKEHLYSAAWGRFAPSLNLEASYNHMNDPLTIDLSPIRQAMIQMQSGNQVEMANIYTLMQTGVPLTDAQRQQLLVQNQQQLNQLLPAFEETLKNQDFSKATLIGVQPLFTGGKIWAGLQFAGSERQAAEAELQRIKLQVTKTVMERYMDVAVLQQVVRTREDVLAGMKQHREHAQKLYKEGLIARYQLLRAEVAVDEAQRNLFKDRNRLQLAITALKNILAISDKEPLNIPAGVRFVGIDDSLQHFLKAARSQQPILQVIAQKENAARQKYVSERANFLPTLAAFGKYELNPDDLSALEPRWVVGLQLNFNLFHGLQDYEQVQSASHLQEEVRQIHTNAGRQVELWVRKAYLNMRNAAERFQRMQSSIDLAQENLNANEKRFKSGLGTSLEVIDARLSLQKAQIDRLMALHDYYYAAADLYAASGETSLLQTIWE